MTSNDHKKQSEIPVIKVASHSSKASPALAKDDVSSDKNDTNKNLQEKDSEQSSAEIKEINGFENKAEPTRYGDWEVGGRCFDF